MRVLFVCGNYDLRTVVSARFENNVNDLGFDALEFILDDHEVVYVITTSFRGERMLRDLMFQGYLDLTHYYDLTYFNPDFSDSFIVNHIVSQYSEMLV